MLSGMSLCTMALQLQKRRRYSAMRKIISLILKIIVPFFAITGTILSMKVRSTFMSGISSLMYFTIQSNIAIAIICIIGAWLMIGKKHIPSWWYTVKYVGTMAITVTGAVFCFILAPTMGSNAWGPINVFTHVIVPIASIVDFFIVGVDSDINKKKVIYTIIPPVIYAIYAGIGYICNWQFSPGVNYPYFFLNWGSEAGAFGFSNELPFLGCVWWILILMVLIILIGLLYLVILDWIKKLVKD